MVKKIFSGLMPIVIIALFFIVMINFKHTETLSAEEQDEIEFYSRFQKEADEMRQAAKSTQSGNEKAESEPRSEEKTSEDVSKKTSEDVAEKTEKDGQDQSKLKALFKDHGPMKKGESGDHIEALQKALGIKIDGTFGANTELAIKQLQYDLGVTSDGVFGQETVDALETSNYSLAN